MATSVMTTPDQTAAPRRRERDREAPLIAPGTRAGSFVIERPIASGGFGAVYEARDLAGRRAAVKVLHGELAASDHVVARFEREVDAIRRIRHPNVVDVYEVGRLEDGRPYYAMELLDGRDLGAVVGAAGRMPPARVAAILGPVCDALAAAHAHGIVHRDVKPGNVLLVGDRAVLVDFGIAKLLDQDELSLTSSRQAIGTPAYMAPEQAGGRVDGRADVYAVGALAFFLLTGTAPFSHESPTMLLYMHRHARRQRPSTRAPVSASIDDVIVRAMRASPADRYPDVGALWEALSAACGEADAAADARSVGCMLRIERRVGEPDDDAVADAIAEVHTEAAARLGAAGFTLAVDGSRSQVWARRADSAPAPVLAAAQAALRAIARRAATAINVRSLLRIGDASWQGGRPVGGELLDLWRWEEAT